MSPCPSKRSAPFSSRITSLSILEATWNAIQLEVFTVMTPVRTSARSVCVATIKWIPAARAICVTRAIALFTSAGTVCIKSANSSMIATMWEILAGIWISSFEAGVADAGPRSATAAVAYGIWPRWSRIVLCDSNSMSASTMMRTSSWKRIFGSQFRIFFALEASPIRRSTSAGRS